MKIDLMALLEAAFDAGFMASAEGYNGEYPFDYDASGINRELSEVRRESLEYIISQVEASKCQDQ